jgi:hypothetical protein
MPETVQVPSQRQCRVHVIPGRMSWREPICCRKLPCHTRNNFPADQQI